MNRLGKSLAAFALCLVAGVVVGILPAAAAGNPDRQLLPVTPDFYIPWCGDVGPVLVHTVVEKQAVKTFTRRDGTVVLAFNGRLVTALSANGKTVTLNTSGPGRIYFRADGSIALIGAGLNLVGNPTGLWLYSGYLELTPDGLVVSHHGGTTDVCAMLT
jgi:hypothetical protein